MSDEQVMLRDVSRASCHDHSSLPKVREQINDGSRQPPDIDLGLWRRAADIGWTGLAVPPEWGGLGAGLIELAIVAQELGRSVARGPFLPTMLCSLEVARNANRELQTALLSAIADGSASATWAFAEHGAAWTVDHLRSQATTVEGGFVVHATKTLVQDADAASWLLVTAVHDDGLITLVVDRHSEGLTLRRQNVLDCTRSFYEVHLDGVFVPSCRRLAGDAGDVQRLLDEASVLYGFEALGVMERMLELTVEYVGIRVQFGKVIGSFQAVQHKCANMATLIQGARAALQYAAMARDAGDPDAAEAACVAASFVSASIEQVTGDALQLHGGIGFTWEHDLHLFLRRAKVNSVLYGDSFVHRDRLCRLIQRERRRRAGTASPSLLD